MAKKKKKDNYVPWLIGFGALALLLMTDEQEQGSEGSAISEGGSYALPRGLRNNNPLNIILTDIGWQGKIPKYLNTDGTFEQFETPEDGYRAAIKNLRYYAKVEGIYSLRNFIDRWDSGKYGDSENYIAYVAKRMGLRPDYVFPAYAKELLYNKDALWKLVRAMAEFENGVTDPNLIRYDEYSDGFDLAT